MTIEQKAHSTLTEEPKIVQIGKKRIKVRPITTATFSAVSAIVSKFPQFKEPINETDINMLVFSLLEGHKYEGIGEIIAILALGQTKGHYNNWWKRRKRKRLADYVDSKIGATELKSILHQLLEGLDLKAFFQLTTSLSELNLLKVKSAIQFGA